MGKYRIETEDGHTYEIETEPTAAEQMGGPGAPSISAPKLPAGLQQQNENFFSAPGFGVEQAVHGVEHMAQPGLKAKLEGAHQAIIGTGKAAMPFLAPAAVANPIGLGLALGGGYVGGKAVRGGLELAGAPPEVKDIGEDVGNIFAGGATLTKPKLGPAIGAGFKAAAPDVATGGAMIGAGELIGKVPGMTWPARIGLGYPGSRQVAHGIYKGIGAAKARFDAPDIVSPPEPSPPGNVSVEMGPKELPPASPQEAASQNTHMPGTTQADEFKPPVVNGPGVGVPSAGAPMPGPGMVTPPTAGLQTPPVQPFAPVPGEMKPNVATPPEALEGPTNGKPILPVSSGLKVSGGETPSGPEVVKANTEPKGEKLIPSEKELSKIEKAFQEQDEAHKKTLRLIEEYKKKHPPK